jgi:hypothetical protein
MIQQEMANNDLSKLTVVTDLGSTCAQEIGQLSASI